MPGGAERELAGVLAGVALPPPAPTVFAGYVT
jgi:hypothetical protein